MTTLKKLEVAVRDEYWSVLPEVSYYEVAGYVAGYLGLDESHLHETAESLVQARVEARAELDELAESLDETGGSTWAGYDDEKSRAFGGLLELARKGWQLAKS